MQTTQNWSLQPLPEMDGQQFRQWQTLLEARTGVCVSDQRKTFLQTSLGARMRELNLADYHTYFEYVTNGAAGAVEWSALIERLTVRETSFMRHRPSFEAVGRHLDLLLKGRDKERPLQLWSVGCASGEEAYSMAIMVEQSLRRAGGHPGGYGIW